MKKSYYCDNYNKISQTSDLNGYTNSDNEKRKLLSLETNRRRRDMAVRVKRQIEKEEERRKQILRERREYHENMSNKLHKTRRTKSSKIHSFHQPQQWDLDQTLNMIRTDSCNSFAHYSGDRESANMNYKTVLEGAWNDIRERCPSPMAKYSGTNTGKRTRTNDFYLKTFETKLIAQEQSFKQKQDFDMNEFVRILDETVVGSERQNNVHQRNVESNETYRINRNITNHEEETSPTLILTHLNNSNKIAENPKDSEEDIMEEASSSTSDEDIDVREIKEKPTETINNCINLTETVKSMPLNNNIVKPSTTAIKSILKKDLSSKFNSNPDLFRIMLRDSVEVTRIKSAGVKRCNSFSQGVDYTVNQTTIHDKHCVDDENGRKFVRFADDPNLHQKDPTTTNKTISMVMNLGGPENSKSSTNVKIQKVPAIPNSTQLKPPLHPRSIQENSYLQVNLKKPTVFIPPAKPKKINSEILENEVESIMNHKKPTKSQSNETLISDLGQKDDNTISLSKTPTEREIDQLWAEVRECLSRTQTPSKTGSAGTPVGLSVRTVDSGSESSVWSAPAWQRNIKKPPSFQVRHHGTIAPKRNVYQGQEPPMKDLVIVHTPHESYINAGVIQQPLSVLTKQDQEFQQVSESLEEFLATEKACVTSQSNVNVFLPHPPPVLNRPKYHPPIKYKLLVPSASPTIRNLNSSNTPRSQLSIDEEKLKMSLDRLDERLKNATKIL